MKKLMIIIAAAFMAITVTGTVFAAEMLNGAGATFPYPLYSKWFYSYEKETGVKINYASIGSGGGIAQIKAGTVDFGASDAPLKGTELRDAGLFQFPMVAGAVAVVYNVPGVDKGLKLNSQTVADIYLGKIKKWNDPAIAKTNPGVKLSGLPIVPVHRSDGSGTTNIFTWFLEDVSSQWKLEVGSGKAVNWPAGLGGKGNEGVAGTVKQTAGAIGYVELAYALQNRLTYAALGNREGEFVLPSDEAAKAAAANAKVPSDYFVRFTYAPGKNSYPVSGYTYLLVKKNNEDKAKLAEFKKFVKWAFEKGDKDADSLNYVPVPDSLKTKIIDDLNKKVK